VRRLAEGHQHDRVEAELRVRLLSQDEVADVRRVERTAEDPKPSSRYGLTVRMTMRKG
jgi:hypothetical protein